MRRTAVLLSLALATLTAAAVAALVRPRPPGPVQVDPAPAQPIPAPPPLVATSAGPLQITAQLARRWLDPRGSSQYLEIDVSAAGTPTGGAKAAVNAVLVIDRSGSMAGAKIERARDAARSLISALDGEDRLAIIDFASDATVLFPSTAMSPGEKERALGLVMRLTPTSGTNLSAAIELAAPQLRAGRAQGRVDKVFLASDGQANEGVHERGALLRLSAARLEGATVSTFGIGDDYDEDLMTALALQGGGRTRFIERPSDLTAAIRAELTRSAQAVAREVRLDIQGDSGARVERVLGLRPEADGSVRLPDFAAGESRRVLVKLRLPAGSGESRLAQVTVRCQDVRGEAYRAEAAAIGTYTAEAKLLRTEANEAALWGARAEMADVAQRAVQAQEKGDAREAAARVAELDSLEKDAAMARPSAAAPAKGYADSWRGMLNASSGGGQAERKKAKQQAYDVAAGF